jgi:hypothetical protein
MNWGTIKKRIFKHAILDSGVEIFLKKHIDDYPENVLWNVRQKSEILSHKYKGKIWVTIPDYPDDFNPGQFGDNITKTLENIEKFITIDGVDWLPVIQCRYLNILSFYESCDKTRKLIGNYPQIAIGTVCKTRKHWFITECYKIARRFFPNSWIHAFGLTLDALPKISNYINSFDNLACYYPRKSFTEWFRDTGLKPFPNTSKTFSASESRKIFFDAYIERLQSIGIELEGFDARE